MDDLSDAKDLLAKNGLLTADKTVNSQLTLWAAILLMLGKIEARL